MSGFKRSRDVMEAEDDQHGYCSDDEPKNMGRQTLPVARLPINFSGEPMDGEQYLFTVRREARKLPSYTRVPNPYAIPAVASASTSVTQTITNGTSSEPKKLQPRTRISISLPSEEWRAIFIQRFKNFRKNSVQPAIGVSAPIAPIGSKVMPEKKERDRWWAFLNGAPESEWNPTKKPKNKRNVAYGGNTSFSSAYDGMNDVAQYEVTYEDESVQEAVVMDEYGEITEEITATVSSHGTAQSSSVPAPLPTSQYEGGTDDSSKDDNAGKLNQPGRPKQPTPALLSLMDSRYCSHILMYFTYWITKHLDTLESPEGLASSSSSLSYTHLTQTHARWVFALLSRVDGQLTSDEISHLRSLARACLALIKELTRNEMSLDSSLPKGLKWIGDPSDAPIDERACWIIITAIADFWGQKDLWMDAEKL